MSKCIDTKHFDRARDNPENAGAAGRRVETDGPSLARSPETPAIEPTECRARLMVTRDIGPYIRTMRDRLEAYRERRFERRQLMKLDDRMLRDIGISRADAEFEYRKPFWR